MCFAIMSPLTSFSQDLGNVSVSWLFTHCDGAYDYSSQLTSYKCIRGWVVDDLHLPHLLQKPTNQICTKNKAYLTFDKLACVRVLKSKRHQPKCYMDFKSVWTQSVLFSSCRCQHGD